MVRGLVGVILFAWLMTFAGCSGSDRMYVADQAYFPLRVGNYLTYHVTETDIQNLNCTDPIPSPKIYELKVSIYDSGKNPTGGDSYEIQRYSRTIDKQGWGGKQ